MTDASANDLTEVQRAIQNLAGPLLEKFKGRVTYYVALAIKGVIQAYPGPANSPVKWPSDKARRAYFAQRREEGLPMKYTRGSDPMSQRLQNAWTVAREPTSATLGNRATYAPYVASEEYQAEQHKATGFMTDAQAVEKVDRDGTMQRIIQATLGSIVKEAFRGLE